MGTPTRWSAGRSLAISLGRENAKNTLTELLIDFITSLDGNAAAGWPGRWRLQGPEYLAWLRERQPDDGSVVLMRATACRVMSKFANEGEPGTGGLSGMSKIVFSRTLEEPLSWANTELVRQDAVETCAG
jgi:hypothetical protein